jgi:NarL family two-component system response regulator YdfI
VIRVLITASSAVVRAGLESLLRASPNITVIGSAEEPDVIVSDWDRSGDDLPNELLELVPSAALIVLADDSDRTWTLEALRSGVRGVLPRDATPSQIISAIEAAAAGLVVLPAEDLENILAAPRQPRSTESLSPREIEVLGMLAEGASNKVIAYRLGISEHTVKFHVTSIMTKLNAGSRTEAVTLGIRQGLIML